jgi:hypothetical protein
MKKHWNAVGWMLASWFVRRWLRQRTARVAVVAGRAAPGRGRLRSVIGGLVLVGVIAGAFVAWRKLAGGESTDEPSDWETAVDVAPEPVEVEPISA